MAAESPMGDIEAIVESLFGDEEPSAEPEITEVQETPETNSESIENFDESGQSNEDPDEIEADDDSEDEYEEDNESEDSDDSEDDEEAPEDGLLSQLVTVKVNGEEMQVTVDQAVKGYQLASAANAKFEEAAKLRESSKEAVEFKETFEALWETNPQELVAHLITEASDPNALVEAAILRAAATGKLSPRVAEALGIDDDVQKELAIAYERDAIKREREEIEQARRNPEEIPDQHGYTVADYQAAFSEMLNVSGLSKATADEQREFISAVLNHGDENGISNPYLAYASYREEQSRKSIERSARAEKAVKKVSKTTKTAAALAPKGRVQHTPTAPEISSTQDAASFAIAEIEKKYGVL